MCDLTEDRVKLKKYRKSYKFNLVHHYFSLPQSFEMGHFKLGYNEMFVNKIHNYQLDEIPVNWGVVIPKPVQLPAHDLIILRVSCLYADALTPKAAHARL